MKAIHVQDDDDHSLVWENHPSPTCGPDEVKIEVHATAVNRADLLQRKGLYPPPDGATKVLGLEASGTIMEVGSDVDAWTAGQRVCALLPGGGYAEQVCVPADLVLEVPDELSLIEAAALPEVFYTAYLNLVLEADLSAGESALVHAGASGVGTAAIQLCRLFEAPVYATASAPKLDFLDGLGVEAAIDRKNEDFADRIAAETDGAGVDVILDPVAGGYLDRDIRCLRTDGRLVVIGLLGGTRDELALDELLTRRLRIIGSVLRSRSVDEKARITDRFRRDVWPHFATGELEPVIYETAPIQQAQRAHDLLHSNETIGKVVLEVKADRT